ncbi:hypothetical protein VSS74_11975 [Conexibacter stalactiti]|uniref:PLL-like beta propeller domain-containing protein n=1 Tax=Conexibacter stalactiti TaxID=1940611 RepID=A0ABU4HP59_9ACTN|nr:hypothetical protein [Conexibacter stalactiti]MDW5595062.1 hypothetical protein [Conexibacter stalactiti]MEC5035704.1 hypothetical protein [Conexibacter stalactiti]
MQLTSGPAASARADGTVDVFAKGPDNAIWHRYLTNGVWSDWGSIGGIGTSAPASTSRMWSPNLDVFVKGNDNRIYHKYWTPADGWTDWGSLDGQFLYAPAVVSHEPGKLDVFGVGTDHQLWQKHWNGSSWTAWIPLGGYLTSAPTVESQEAGKVDVFARDANNNIAQRSWNGASWSQWVTISTIATSGPTALSEGIGRVVLFVRGGPQVYVNQLITGLWTGWGPFGATEGPIGIPQEPLPPANGTLIRGSGSSTVYLLFNGVRYTLGPGVAAAMQLDLNAVTGVSQSSVDQLVDGGMMTTERLNNTLPEPDPDDARTAVNTHKDHFLFYSADRKARVSATLQWSIGLLKPWIYRGDYTSNSWVSPYNDVGCIWVRVTWSMLGAPTLAFPPGLSISGATEDSGYYRKCRRAPAGAPDGIPLDRFVHSQTMVLSSTIRVCSSNTAADGPGNCSNDRKWS